jgi:ferric-dicitrate binding protein FerR (iron transport regulator)
MNRPDDMSREAAAARWFAAQRRGVMSIEEREALDHWRRDGRNAAAMADIERRWEMLKSLEREFSDGAALPAASVARRNPARPMLVAAVCALSLVIGALSYGGHSAFWTTLDWTDR